MTMGRGSGTSFNLRGSSVRVTAGISSAGLAQQRTSTSRRMTANVGLLRLQNLRRTLIDSSYFVSPNPSRFLPRVLRLVLRAR